MPAGTPARANATAAVPAGASGSPALEVKAASVVLRRRHLVLEDVDLRCHGGVTALVGPNGSGKSTLLRAVVGLVPLSSGTVRVAGHDTRSQLAAVRRQVGYLPQKAAFPGRFTVAEALAYAAWLQALGARAARRRTTELVSALGLEEHLNHSLTTLSGGTRQRVYLAQALIHRPALLLLDEPTVGLDLTQQAALRDVVHHLARDSTVLLSTHHTEDLEHLAHNVLVLRKGRRVWQGSVTALRNLAPRETPQEQGTASVLESAVSTLLAAD